MALSAEELLELAKLEKDDIAELEAIADAAKRRHLEALRLARRLAPKHGTHRDDFLVVETDKANFALRRPNEQSVKGLAQDIDGDRADAAQEGFILDCLIEPNEIEAKTLFAKYPKLVGLLIVEAYSLLGRKAETDAKK